MRNTRSAGRRNIFCSYGVELPRLGFKLPAQPDIIAPAVEARQSGKLEDPVLRPVWRLMEQMNKQPGAAPLSYDVLDASYVAASLLDRCLERRRSPYLSDLRKTLVDQNWLSPAQVDCLNRNVATIDRKPYQLDPDSFRKARPDWSGYRLGV